MTERVDYRTTINDLIKADPAKALRAVLTLLVVEINTVRSNPTTTYPPLTEGEVFTKLKAIYRNLT